MTKSLASLVAVSFAFVAAACGSAPAPEAQRSSGQAVTVDPAFTGCAFDSDCVAVPQAGCCSNGWLAAVSSCEVAAYETANACVHQNMMCMQYVVNDTRVALCDDTASACTMVAPTSIRCGGDGANAHACPTGYSCVLGPDDTTVGTCAQTVVAAPSDDAGAAGDDAATTAN